jgi:hypothetical protein
MKVIYLDIDGVLNCSETKARIMDSVGLDGKLLGNLKKIVEKTNAKIVLISTWKEGWVKDKVKKPFQSFVARYLDEKFSAHNLKVFDKTENKADGKFLSRGEGILRYNETNGIDNFIIIDDYQYDYDGCALTARWVKTDFNQGGLTEQLALDAIELISIKK